jgi:hypothetical protein
MRGHAACLISPQETNFCRDPGVGTLIVPNRGEDSVAFLVKDIDMMGSSRSAVTNSPTMTGEPRVGGNGGRRYHPFPLPHLPRPTILRDSVPIVQIVESEMNRVPFVEYESRDGRAKLRFHELPIFRVPSVTTTGTFVYVTVAPLIIDSNLFI